MLLVDWSVNGVSDIINTKKGNNNIKLNRQKIRKTYRVLKKTLLIYSESWRCSSQLESSAVYKVVDLSFQYLQHSVEFTLDGNSYVDFMRTHVQFKLDHHFFIGTR